MDEFSTPLSPEEFERVWSRVSPGRDGPVVPGRPDRPPPPPPGPDRPVPPPPRPPQRPTPPPPRPDRPVPPPPPPPGPPQRPTPRPEPPAPPPPRPDRPVPPPPRPPERPVPPPPGPNRPVPPPPPEPPCLGPECRESEAFLRSMIDRELERSRSAQSAPVPPRIAAQALSRAKRLSAALYLITGRWYLPQRSRVQRWRDRRAALRGLYQQSQRLERDYRREAQRVRDRELRQLCRELADECAAEQQFLRHQLEI